MILSGNLWLVLIPIRLLPAERRKDLSQNLVVEISAEDGPGAEIPRRRVNAVRPLRIAGEDIVFSLRVDLPEGEDHRVVLTMQKGGNSLSSDIVFADPLLPGHVPKHMVVRVHALMTPPYDSDKDSPEPAYVMRRLLERLLAQYAHLTVETSANDGGGKEATFLLEAYFPRTGGTFTARATAKLGGITEWIVEI